MATITRFLRYPGSKRRMLSFLVNHLPGRDDIQGNYFEPFVGSGSVFFSINPRTALLSDLNLDLIELFKGIRRNPKYVWALYNTFGNTKKDFIRIRSEGEKKTIEERAARTLYLNRTCFKGMWRSNKKGEFNVGYGGQERRWVINEENLREVARYLRKATIRQQDFESAVEQASMNDYIFADPPYKPKAKTLVNGHYSGHSFTFDDQVRLARVLASASTKGVNWSVTNSSHPDILTLYSGCYMIDFPKGTSGQPGVMVENSGEVLIANYQLSGGSKIQ